MTAKKQSDWWLLSPTEWRKISLVLPHSSAGRPRTDDHLVVSAFCLARATGRSLEHLPEVFGNSHSLRTRQNRWSRDGTLAKIEPFCAKAVARMTSDWLYSLGYHNQRREFRRGARVGASTSSHGAANTIRSARPTRPHKRLDIVRI